MDSAEEGDLFRPYGGTLPEGEGLAGGAAWGKVRCGADGKVWQARQRGVRYGAVRCGTAGKVWPVADGQGKVLCGWHGVAGLGGMGLGTAGGVWHVGVRCAEARYGMVWLGWRGRAWRGMVRYGSYGKACYGTAG